MSKEDSSLKYIENEFLLQNSPAVTYVCKAYGDFGALFITDNVKDQMGYLPEQFITNPSFWAENIHPDDRAEVFENLPVFFEQGNYVHEYRFLHADGEYRWMRDELNLIKDESGQAKRLVGYWIDITQRKQAEIELHASNKILNEMIKARSQELETKLEELAEKEKQLLQAQKIEALGQLTGGIAHDFNNTIGIILGFSEILSSKLSTKRGIDKEKKYLQNIIDAANRSSDLVKKMLAFSRKDLGEREVIDVNEYIKETVNLLTATIPASIAIDVISGSADAQLNIDSTYLNQLIMNLVINSRDAMINEKGRIEISINEVSGISSSCNSCHTKFEGEYIEIVVSDNGIGISDKDGMLDRIFDPFFSTKDVGKGTGMGLSVVHGIVHANKGHLRVSSVPGEGSEFKIYLPRFAGDIEFSDEEAESIFNETMTGRILIVDDEESVCCLLNELLSNCGYEVETYTDPRQALKSFEKNQDHYDLLVTDQTMPYISGQDMAIRALQIKPELPIIMCTGHSDLMNEQQAVEIGIKKFLKKPINTRELVNIIGTLLEE